MPGGNLDADVVRRWIRHAGEAMRAHADQIDALNVFPVADRDTGSNLVHTLAGAAAAVSASDELLPAVLMDQLARGAALAAHGNSGVIVAQLLRGIADQLATEPGPIGALAWSRAFEAGRAAAFLAVQDPVEGTVLSVLAAASLAGHAELRERPAADLGDVLTASVRAAAVALDRTRDQLDPLADAGVVDAGGAGVVVLLEALLTALTGEAPGPKSWSAAPPAHHVNRASDGQFEVQYVVEAELAAVGRLRDALARLGDSVSVAATGDGRHAVHVHALDAGAAIEAALEVGRPRQIRVRALSVSAPAATEIADHRDSGTSGVVAIAAGPGIVELFRQSGVLTVGAASGSDEVLAALLATGARRVVLLPNSVDAGVLAADAADRGREQGIGVAVVPTRSPVQGLAAVAVHDASRRFDDDVIAMAEAAAATRVAEVSVAQQESITYAGRCQAGDVLGLIDGEVVEIGSDFGRVGCALARRLIAAGGELVTVLVGAGPDSERSAAAVQSYVRTRHPLVEVTTLRGGQTDCPLLIGVE